jgi:hypothetical protein
LGIVAKHGLSVAPTSRRHCCAAFAAQENRRGTPALQEHVAEDEMLDTEIRITQELAAEHGLTAEEYTRIQKILGRDPNFTELGIFSVMWSEHCSY